jgi:hypothetical protein
MRGGSVMWEMGNRKWEMGPTGSGRLEVRMGNRRSGEQGNRKWETGNANGAPNIGNVKSQVVNWKREWHEGGGLGEPACGVPFHLFHVPKPT